MGSERVGKTSIVSQFLYDKFTPRYRRTTEDLHRGEYELADGATLTLDILDTCGAMEFPAMRRLSIQFGNAFLLVYAVNDAETWKEVASLRAVVSLIASNNLNQEVHAMLMYLKNVECSHNFVIAKHKSCCL